MHPLIVFLRLLAPWPLAWVRALGVILGGLLFWVVPARRRVVRVMAVLFQG